MLRQRIIPCLLIHNGGLVKTVNFANPKYVGDPINAVRIFNEKEADELAVFDIDATVNGASPNYTLIRKIAAECRMPLCYGGGVSSLEQASQVINLGVEKVAVSAAALNNPKIISELARTIGSQSVVVVLDVMKKKSLFNNGWQLCSHNGSVKHNLSPMEAAARFCEAGAGEIVVNSVDRDGTLAGYDIDLAKKMCDSLSVPLTMLGGAGALEDITRLFSEVGLVGAAAGSLFVFKGKYKAVLINYPQGSNKSSVYPQKSWFSN